MVRGAGGRGFESWPAPSWPPGVLATPAPVSARTPRWFAAGDVNGFLGLALDNTTNLVIMSSLLIGVFGFPADLVLGRMLPGTALGVLVGRSRLHVHGGAAHASHRTA